MKELTRRELITASAIGAAGLLLPSSFAFADTDPLVGSTVKNTDLAIDLYGEFSIADISRLTSENSSTISLAAMEKIRSDSAVLSDLRVPLIKELVTEVTILDDVTILYTVSYGDCTNVICVDPQPNGSFDVIIRQDELTNVLTLDTNGIRYLDGNPLYSSNEAVNSNPSVRAQSYWSTAPLVGTQSNYNYYSGYTNQNSNIPLTKTFGQITLSAFTALFLYAIGVPAAFAAASNIIRNMYNYGQSNFPWSNATSYKAPYYYYSSAGPVIPGFNGACIQYRFTFYLNSNYAAPYAGTHYWYYCSLY